MPVPNTYYSDFTKQTNLDSKIWHFAPVDRFLAYIKGGAIYSKATLWAKDLYPVLARTQSADADNGFIDYIFFCNYNWLLRGRNCSYGYICLETDFRSVFHREHFYYTFNSGIDWKNHGDEHKYCDLTTLDKIFDYRKKYWSAEIIVRRKVPFSDVKNVYIPKGLTIGKDIELIDGSYPTEDIDAKVYFEQQLIQKNIGVSIGEKEMNPTQNRHATSKGYKIVFDVKNSLGVELDDIQFSSDDFEIESLDNSNDKLVFFFLPSSAAVSGLIAKPNGDLFVRDTEIKVGRLEKDEH